MAYKDLTFLLFAKDMSASRGFEKVALAGDKMSKGISGSMGLVGVALAGAAVSIGAKSVEMAAAFESATTRLVTDAGTSQSQLGMVRQGILKISDATGTAATEIASGMYTISSAGYTGAKGLEVLHAAAEGAKVGYADLGTTSDALTVILRDFAGKNAPTAMEAMNGIIATVSHGKTTVEALAGSLHNVLPQANIAGLSLQQVLGAMATMTGEGISADQASQNLNHAIGALASPSQVAADAMANVGLSSLDVAKNLGQRGLTGTYDVLTHAIATHMKGGLVALNLYNTSAQAAASFKSEIAGLPAPLRSTAKAFEEGHITAKQWSGLMKQQPATIANLGKQFATTVKHAEGFNSAVKSGQGPARTFLGQLDKMTGGMVGAGVAAHLTGDHMKDFKGNVNVIGDALHKNGKHVTDWGEQQKTLNAQLDKAKTSFGNAGIAIGTALMPALKEIVPEIPKVAHFITKVIDVLGDGVTAFNKWVNDVRKSVGDFFGIVGAIPGKVKGFFDGANQWLMDAGVNIITGLVSGIQSKFAQVGNVIGDIANTVKSVFTGPKGIDSHSPSKVFETYGHYIGDGLTKGLLGSTAQVSAATAAMATAVRNAFADKQLSKGAERAALADVKAMTDANSKLARLGKERTAVLARESALKSSRSGVYNDTTAATRGYGDVTGFAAPGDAVQGLQALVSKTKTFTGDLKSLRSHGISTALLTQLVNGWNSDPDAALTTANGLLANPTDLRQIMGLQSQLASAGASLGSYAAHSEYDSPIRNASSKAKVLTWEMQRAAESGLRKVAADTHVHLHLTGTYAGTDVQLGKTVVYAIEKAEKSGQLSKNWRKG